ncbi:GNAT family N-acetyltransferase [Flagellimonas sp. S3867]|uniref:GNAT family N-acetyltransferase n=1 Tax=Flagellimonas sp. S3867 TaxID=2768063 RepID=UPI001685FC06|nr:GNAT family N-acetyltransferase [Flagellimonas sp. S3867]
MSLSDFTLREAIHDDLPVLLHFEQELIRAERPFDITIREDPVSYYDIEKMIPDDNSCVVVVEHDGNIVASGYAQSRRARHYLDHEHYSYLGFMFTLPEFRGKGLNARIMDALKEWSFTKGLKEMRLTVYDGNDPAIKAYEKVGFKKHIIEMRLE